MSVIHYRFPSHHTHCTECDREMPVKYYPLKEKVFCSGRCAVNHYKREAPKLITKAMKGTQV